MKSSKAPEKIYLSDFTDTTESVFYVKQDNTKKTDIEYTRTDTFIEKACEWLLNHNDYLENPYANVTSFNIAKLVTDFRKAME